MTKGVLLHETQLHRARGCCIVSGERATSIRSTDSSRCTATSLTAKQERCQFRLRGTFTFIAKQRNLPHVICHFSNWGSGSQVALELAEHHVREAIMLQRDEKSVVRTDHRVEMPQQVDGSPAAEREMDAALADSFPASDPPSWTPAIAETRPGGPVVVERPVDHIPH